MVRIGDGAFIILGVEGGKVRLGFDFPPDTEIWRSELRHLTPPAKRLLEIKQERVEARD
jgi:sRNA-binding carbon storage regulator CsrA